MRPRPPKLLVLTRIQDDRPARSLRGLSKGVEVQTVTLSLRARLIHDDPDAATSNPARVCVELVQHWMQIRHRGRGPGDDLMTAYVPEPCG